MLRKAIPIIGEKWDAALERWKNGVGKSFKDAHERYLHDRLERARRVVSFRRKSV